MDNNPSCWVFTNYFLALELQAFEKAYPKLFDYLDAVNAELEKTQCRCDSKLLFMHGCQCGGR